MERWILSMPIHPGRTLGQGSPKNTGYRWYGISGSLVICITAALVIGEIILII